MQQNGRVFFVWLSLEIVRALRLDQVRLIVRQETNYRQDVIHVRLQVMSDKIQDFIDLDPGNGSFHMHSQFRHLVPKGILLCRELKVACLVWRNHQIGAQIPPVDCCDVLFTSRYEASLSGGLLWCAC